MPIPSRILIVEDEDIIRRLLAEAMIDEGFAVLDTASAEEALHHLHDGETVDLLMTDVELAGGLDGLGLAAAARRRRPRLPIIFTTGQPDRMLPWQTGAGDLFISKPYRPSLVAVAARRLIAA